MTSARHRTVAARGRRRSLLKTVLPAAAAVLVTASVVATAVAHGGGSQREAAPVAQEPVRPVIVDSGGSPYRAERLSAISRSAERVTLRKKPAIKRHEFMTASLNLWPAPAEKGKPLAVLKEGGRVALTGVRRGGFAQILRGGQIRWVNGDYLTAKKPAPTGSAAGVTSAPCPDGSGTESGLTSSAVTLFRSVCNAFPALTTYGGYDAHGEHASGRAIDFMTSDPALGTAVADWVRAHASELNIYDVIWRQHIWTPVRSGEGWRLMPSRGSETANHFDHVHVAVN